MIEDKLDNAAQESLARIVQATGLSQEEIIEVVNREVARRQNVLEFSRFPVTRSSG